MLLAVARTYCRVMAAVAVRAAASPDSVGGRIRRLRLQRNLSQQDLAGPALSASYVSLIESGRRRPSAGVLSFLADRLQVNYNDLASGTGSAEAEAVTSIELARAALAARYPQAALELLEPLLAEEPGCLTESAPIRVRLLRAMALAGCGRNAEAVADLDALHAQNASGGGDGDLAVATALCVLYGRVGDAHRSVEWGERAVSSARALGCEQGPWATALAAGYWVRGDYLSAQGTVAPGLGSLRHLHRPADEAWAAALLASERGRPADASILAEVARQERAGGTAAATASLLVRAAALLSSGSPREALAVLDVNGSDPQDGAAWALRAACQLSAQDPRSAVKSAMRAARLSPPHGPQQARARALLAHALLQVGRRQAAAVQCHRGEQALVASADGAAQVAAWASLGEAYAALQNDPAAVRCYRASVPPGAVPFDVAELLRGLAADALC